MEHPDIVTIVYDLFVILAAGWLGGVVAKRLGVSMLVGYLLAGAAIGHGALGLVADDLVEIEHLAHAGALLLLFAIGIEFSLEDLVRSARHLLVGGSLQMVLVAAPVLAVCMAFGVSWRPALLIAAATALSSTVLVFRALSEWGETATRAGRRAIGVLLFQDIALVPLMLMVPLLTGDGDDLGVRGYLLLALNSVLFVVAVLALRRAFQWWIVPLMTRLRSVELVVLFALIVLVGFCLGAHAAGLPPALGAFAAGLVLSGNRLSGQVDALILPYRESFGVVFFVSLGTLFDPGVFIAAPLLLIGILAAVLVVKTLGAALALRATGLSWRVAAGMGLGLAQLGELSFILLSQGLHAELITQTDYNRMLLVAMGTLVLTPPLLRVGLGAVRRSPSTDRDAEAHPGQLPLAPKEAIVIGLGPIGRRAASQLEIMGIDVCLVDSSPVNLYAYAQQGFRTIAGDACDADVLRHADAARANLAIVCVPDDRIAAGVVRTLRRLNAACTIVVRCRYQTTIATLRAAGADTVVSEEAETSIAFLRLLERMER